ncbi:2-amino-4-hydroxy-6-hydroxymethyldihydropteridine diphosphokinase [Halobacillus litoralis]|uniref:2-amino-4-hydroxy-6- hydroxymethyldihydropteridine diphosphokinase n=1 Tax=Halobacillus litoralis TaxID=45668 RepID=UPI001CFD6067|nr:2-amino-4-hydroxy-6-hydroxymethyldihydropteridine diphosphokinase [Halobacillus litoralis]
MSNAFIALGSNLAEREGFLKDALTLLDEHQHITVRNKSSVYETAPVGYTEQNDFLNMVVEVETALPPTELLDYCQRIELDLGRRRIIKWGPRTIDLDILLYNHENMKAERLTIPHPYMQDRAFVMVPLADVAPGIVLPHTHLTAEETLSKLPPDEVDSVKLWGKI